VDALTLVITCEHASWEVPEALAGLGLERDTLRSHASWDAGAREIAARIAESFDVPRLEGRWSRLVADLNRDPQSHEVVPEVAFGVPVPGNTGLDAKTRTRRVADYHAPYWAEAEGRLAAGVARGRVVHLSVHTFDPHYGRDPRPWDFGICHDPDTPFEAPVARELERALAASGRIAAPNVPYDGRSDFLITSMRRRFAPERYAGIMLEVSQRHLPALSAAAEGLRHALDVTLRWAERLPEASVEAG
jgi:predicted N-formylglutamate amidohydrolase